MNILLSTFGQTWPIVPEILGLTNPSTVPLYKNYSEKKILQQFKMAIGNKQVDQLWLILTEDNASAEALKTVQDWYRSLSEPNFQIKEHFCLGTNQLANASECRLMSEYIHRIVLNARETAGYGELWLSLAGGRKTMSADLQHAATQFGCQLLFHVADSLQPNSLLRKNNLQANVLSEPLDATDIDKVFPVIIAQNIAPSILLSLPNLLKSNDYPVDQAPDLALLHELEKRENQSKNLLQNAYFQRRRESPASYYHGLQLLPPPKIYQLENHRIGEKISTSKDDLAWIKCLPKADLHCHLGGVLDTPGIIAAGNANHAAIQLAYNQNSEFKAWLDEVAYAVKNHDSKYFNDWPQKWKKLREKFTSVEGSTTISAFVNAFAPDPDFLDQIIFGPFINNSDYCNIGIQTYEALGDLQGSGLLGAEPCLRFTLRYLVDKCREENVTYCEVRCSPAKYASHKLDIYQVTDIIKQELQKASSTLFKLIIIASRHAPENEMKEHISLVSNLIERPDFDHWFAGFDLAGDEKALSPGQLRDAFDPLLHHCINVTIHAGETAPANNIWEAVYMLNADRIGHGLTLRDDPKLLKRFANKGTVLEMCPSSNFQIVGYKDFCIEDSQSTQLYPLREYLNQNLIVTINTDNRGISRTNLSQEYLKAAQMTKGGLSEWDILQLIRNGFKSAFATRNTRKKLLLNSEEQILKLLSND
jgi:adenosine deaminase